MLIIIVNLILFLLMLYAMKEIMKESLSEFKAEIIKEFNLTELINKQQGGSPSEGNAADNTSDHAGQADINSKENE